MWLAGATQASAAAEPPLRPLQSSGEPAAPAPQTVETETLVNLETWPGRTASNTVPQQPTALPVYGLRSVSHRWWIPRGRTELGMGVGTLAYEVAAMPGPAVMAGAAWQQAPTVSLGIRYHLSADARVYADATRARSPDALSHRYGSTVGIEFQPAAPSALGLDNLRGKASLRMQLSSGYQMSLRLRRHGFRIVLRSDF